MVLRRIVLTGASGMLGRHLLPELTGCGLSCIATSRQSPPGLPPGSSWFPWDLAEPESTEQLCRVFRGADALVHLAAAIPGAGAPLSRPQIFETNVRACLCLGEVALDLGIPLLYVSSATVYADPERCGIREEDAKLKDGGGSWYGLSKLMGEQVLQHLAGQGLRLCILRPSSLYGYGLPNDKLIPRLLIRAARGELIELDPPFDTVDLIHAADLARAILGACQQGALGIYNVSSGVQNSILEIAQGCLQAAQSGELKVRDTEPGRAAGARFGLDCSAARAAFGYRPQVSLAEGLRRTLSDLRSHQPELFGCGD